MSRIKIVAICLAVFALIGADAYTYQCYQEERAANEVLIRDRAEALLK